MAVVSPRAERRLILHQEREAWKGIIRSAWSERDRPIHRAAIKVAVLNLRTHHTQLELS